MIEKHREIKQLRTIVFIIAIVAIFAVALYVMESNNRVTDRNTIEFLTIYSNSCSQGYEQVINECPNWRPVILGVNATITRGGIQ